VGLAARNQELLHPRHTIRSSKRRIGTDHTYELNGYELKGQEAELRRLSPTDVAADILRYLAAGAEHATGVRPQRVVITVPAWFTQTQRNETRRAGELAGLEVVRILNEPTAAALAHAHGKPRTRRVLVYDFGGGTFDVSLVEQDGPILEVKASHGDVSLGGDDVDDQLVDFVLGQLDQRDPLLKQAIEADPAALARLREAVEQAKITLSEAATARLAVPFITEVDGDPSSLDMVLEREDLEDIVIPLFVRTTASVDRVIDDAGCTPDDIDELLLVGGSSSLPQVWKGLRLRYGLQGDASLPPRLAVALGATIQAAIVDGSKVDGVLVDIAPYALSIGMSAGGAPGFPTHFVCEVITPRNAALPSRHTHLVRTGHPQQPRIRLPVYQGSHPDARQNKLLGEIVMESLPPAPHDRLFRPIAVEVRHNVDGVVDITVTDQLSGISTHGRIVRDGVEQQELQTVWEDYVSEHGMMFGDPFDVPVRDDDDPEAASSPELEEARQLFRTILEAEDQLQQDHADAAARALELARAGSLAATMHRIDDALARAEELGDLMFEEGIYL
jgi:molecular chaperone DnaK